MTEEEIKLMQEENAKLKKELEENKESKVVKELNDTLEKERKEHKEEIEKIKKEKEEEKIKCVRAILTGKKDTEEIVHNEEEQDMETQLANNIIKSIKGGK